MVLMLFIIIGSFIVGMNVFDSVLGGIAVMLIMLMGTLIIADKYGDPSKAPKKKEPHIPTKDEKEQLENIQKNWTRYITNEWLYRINHKK